MDNLKLYQLAHDSLLNLATEEGINASGKNDIYGCVFGRDTALTVLKILRAHKKQPNTALLEISKRALLSLVKLQGTEVNIESGEQPGKFIHEFRKTDFGHLLSGERPWYVYPDGLMRNYDSIDATPLALIALYKYWEATQDNGFLLAVLPAVEAGLNWIVTYGDIDKDQLLEYEFPEERRFGGLSVHSWTDSHQSVIRHDGTFPAYPIAPIEVQGFAWLALKLWGDFYLTQSPTFAHKIISFADAVKRKFNQKFIFKDYGIYFGAQALDGRKSQIQTVTGNPLLCLWAAYQGNGRVESIVDERYIPGFIKRTFLPDMFIEDAGIRTMSALAPNFNPNQDSYHNGSFWPILNGLAIEGLENFGFVEEAEKLKTASLKPFAHFSSPVELYIRNAEGYSRYCNAHGQTSCQDQAWSAAALLDMTTV